jgi:hypothetical protein
MVWDCNCKHVTTIVTMNKMNRFIRNLNFDYGQIYKKVLKLL